ncbi:MAG: CCA-adding enzyme [Phycisphaerae bacterium]|nr:CCA-adding enzyme [Phycisphaerae bacterium]
MSARRDRATTEREAAEEVAARLVEAGHEALFAGGCVRDLLMGRSPSDFDIATDARPDRVCELFRRTLRVGAQFGVVIVLVGRRQIEVATFRSEADYSDGRHPDRVEFSDARADALRRDFTINGMFMQPADGEVIDYVGGRADLDARIVRAIGSAADRFAEDRLRMLRAVRFASVLDFALDEATADAIRTHVGRIGNVSSERIWQEWRKLLADRHRARGWELAERTGLVAAIWPGLIPLAGPISDRLAALPDSADEVAALACQLMDLPTVDVHAACRALTIDNDRRTGTAWLIEHARDLSGGPLSLAPLKKLMAGPHWTRLAQVAAVVTPAQGPAADALAANLARAAEIPPDQVAPPPLLDGRDVMGLGVAAGPAVGAILATLYDEQLEGHLASRDAAVARARELIAMRSG